MKKQNEIPAKFVLYCDYPGSEFREEMDVPEIDGSDDEDYEFSVDDVLYDLHDTIADTLYSELDYNSLLGVHYTEDDVCASGHFWFGEVRTSEFGDADLPLNEDVKVYLDSVAEDGTVTDYGTLTMLSNSDTIGITATRTAAATPSRRGTARRGCTCRSARRGCPWSLRWRRSSAAAR